MPGPFFFAYLLYLSFMNVKLKPEKYLRYLYLPNLFGTQRTKEILHVNPTVVPARAEANEVSVTVYHYDANTLEEKKSDRRFRFGLAGDYRSTIGRPDWKQVGWLEGPLQTLEPRTTKRRGADRRDGR